MICANPCTREYTNVHAPIVWYTYKGMRTQVKRYEDNTSIVI